MARNFSKSPSQLFGIVDRRIALDFNRLSNLRLVFFDVEMQRAQNKALETGSAHAAADDQEPIITLQSESSEMLPKGSF